MWGYSRSRLLVLVTIGALVMPGARAVAAASSHAGRLVRVSGASPFADCPTAGLDELLPSGEAEPVVVADPTDPDTAVTAWPQDRFRGIVAGVAPTAAGAGGRWSCRA
jgi:hypothetical protein